MTRNDVLKALAAMDQRNREEANLSGRHPATGPYVAWQHVKAGKPVSAMPFNAQRAIERVIAANT